MTGTAVDTGGPGPAAGIHSFYVSVGEIGSDHAIALTGTSLRQDSDGVWRGALTIPAGVQRASWPLWVYLDDTDDEFVQYGDTNYLFIGPVELQQDGFPSELQLLTRPDRQPPRLRSLRITPRSIDNASSGRRIRVRARITDNSSGVNRVEGSVGRAGLLLRHVRGSRRDGIWAGSVPAAKLRSVRRWPVSLWAEDRADPQEFERSNGVEYSAEELHLAGFPSWVTVHGGVDGSRPQVGRVRVSSHSVDVRTSDATVTVRARIRDAGSGIERATSHFGGSIFSLYSNLKLLSGTRQDGIWAATVVFDHCADDLRSRRYTPSVNAWDLAGRWGNRSVDTAAVAVTAGDTTQPRTRNCDFYPPGVKTVCFSEDVTGITSQTAVVHPNDEPPTAAVTGTWLCQDQAGVVTACEFGRVRRAQFTPDAPTSASLRVTLNPPHTLGITDMAGNPILSYL